MSQANINIGRSYLGGVEKAHVRAQCWMPLLENRKRSAGRRIRYVTLPGRQLSELRDLVDKKVIEGPNDLVLIESDLMDYYRILKGAPLLDYRCKVEPVVVLHGDINDLILQQKLDPFLPADAINLDYCGFFWGTETMASRKWSAVKRLIEVQGRRGSGEQAHPFTLLLTVQGRGDAKEHIDETLHEYREDVGDEWERIAGYPYHGKLLYALP